ncbi:MAG: biotin/lipoyl-containing protein [Terriglobales bacterium]
MDVYQISVSGKTHKVEVEPLTAAPPSNGELAFRVRLDGREVTVNCVPLNDRTLSLILNGQSFEVQFQLTAESLQVALRGAICECIVSNPRSLRTRKKAGLADSGEQKLTAGMPGKVVRIIAAVGDQIKAGQGILVIEAMKMQNEVRSPKDGQLKKLLVGQGANVVAGEALAIIE